MKIERTKNATRNIISGFLQKLYSVIIPFFMRTVLIYLMGVEYLGLNSLFFSILSVLNLAELGVGVAMTFAMYRPIAEDDTDEICAIMRLYRTYYRVIGLVVLGLGLAVLPFVPDLVRAESIPEDVNIYVLYSMNLGATVLNYWLFAYKHCLLSAFQRRDIYSKITMCCSTVAYVLQFAIIYFFRDFYLYTVIALMISIISDLIVAMFASRMYPQYVPRGEVSTRTRQELKSRIFALFGVKIAAVMVNAADTLVISSFLGLKEAVVYNNYYYIINAVMQFVMVIYSSIQAGIGNSLVTESKEKNIRDFRKYHFMNNWITTLCTACLLCLYQPFMEIWVGRDLMLSNSMAILFGSYFYINMVQRIAVVYKDAAGMWKEDVLRSYFVCGLNLLINIITIRSIGLYGVVGSSVISYLIGKPWLAHNVYKYVFGKSALKFYLAEVRNSIFALFVCGTTYGICQIVPGGFKGVVIRSFICVGFSNLLLFMVYGRTRLFQESFSWCKAFVLQKIKHS